MRLFTPALLTTIALALLAGCSGNMATPSASGAGLSGQSFVESGLYQLSKYGSSHQQALERVAIQTSNGINYVTAIEGGGGPNGPNCGRWHVALYDNATSIGRWEIFTLVFLPSAHRYAFRTSDGKNYVTAVRGGGIGGDGHSELETNATSPFGPWGTFTLVPVNAAKSEVAIQTPDGIHYVTAVNGGGCGGPNNVPFHTDATKIGPWEQFTLIKP